MSLLSSCQTLERFKDQNPKNKNLLRGYKMNRNNFLPHVALALVVILIAAFAGQVRNWRKDWHSHRHMGKARFEARVDLAPLHSQPDAVKKGIELFVRFR